MDLNRGSISRRGFLQRSVAGLAAVGLPVWYAKELVADAEQDQAKQKKPVQANDTILMGHIGCGNTRNGRGGQIAPLAAAIPGVQYVACCDVDRANMESFAGRNPINRGRQLTQFADFRELLARRDINAVTIATVDHWHALVAVAAMRAGKDVYCEKPLTLTVNEGKVLRQVARDTNRRLQTGTQQRTEFGGRFRLAAELVRNGRIGRVQTIECRIGENPRGGPFTTSQPPASLNWDFWMGPTPRCDYVTQKCHYDFRWWYEYSGGKMTDWGAHHLDVAQWALNMDASGPVEVEGRGDAPDPRPLTYNCHRNFNVNYRYANGTTMRVYPGADNENGIRFNGEDGKWLFVSRNAITASAPGIINDALPNNAVRLGRDNSHMVNFINCVRSREQPVANVEVGHRSVTVCHIGNIAIRTGQRLRWNPETEQFVDNEAANRWLSREYRAPWRLEA